MMKTEITGEDYKDYYQAVDWNPVVFEKLLRHLDYDFGNLTVIGHLNLNVTKITHLVGVKEVKGDLYLMNSNIISLGDLEEVSGYLDLEYTPIESLGSLQKVGWDLYLDNTPINSLGNLRKVGGDLYLRNTPASQKYSKEEIRQMVEVEGAIWAHITLI